MRHIFVRKWGDNQDLHGKMNLNLTVGNTISLSYKGFKSNTENQGLVEFVKRKSDNHGLVEVA